ncbi:nuclear transport factor 2 family protein [Alloalcanivorax mobilis]|uniref:nuclear transport factor 2 family protein n=1 Tax=Alloalcanivorax mobilis TaxID=2019569 RepID=UPI000C75C69A|nr:nuclear transport factor 2 family protein [Alloalcanivorax mobilis]
MAIHFPAPIALFFQLSNDKDSASLDRCFAPDAAVHDEKHTYNGIAEITDWFIEAKKKYSYTADPLEMEEHDTGVVVRARVSGNFPGSPAVLRYVFETGNDKIQSLAIG